MKTQVYIGIGVLVVIGVFSAWHIGAEPQPTPPESKEVYEKPEPNAATLTLSSDEVVQGGVLVVAAQGPITELRLDDTAIPLAPLPRASTNETQEADNTMVAVIGFDTRAEIGPRSLQYETPSGTQTKAFRVVERAYPVTRIEVPEKLAQEGVTSGDLAQSVAANDNVTLTDIIDVATEAYHIQKQFVAPTDEWIDVGGFGNVRADQYGSIRHLGVDLEGETGDPVYATNDGVVVFAGTLQNYGNSVVIDHGVGIYSIYLHLSAIETDSGTSVAAGERIARIGNTGAYTLAPHLHFSIKVGGVSVDPRIFIDTFNTIL